MGQVVHFDTRSATAKAGRPHRECRVSDPPAASPMTRFTVTMLAIILLVAPASVLLAQEPSFSLTIHEHRFAPAELTIPANTRVRLVVKNADATPAEFESDDFKAEKVVPAGREVSITVGPLKPGTYEFHDEYHENESKSRLIVK